MVGVAVGVHVPWGRMLVAIPISRDEKLPESIENDTPTFSSIALLRNKCTLEPHYAQSRAWKMKPSINQHLKSFSLEALILAGFI